MMVTLVILPGMDGTGLMLDAFISALGPSVNATVVRYPKDQPLDYADLENIARAALPEEGDFFILGESFSGPIAVSLAAARSPRLKGLVLSCSFVRSPRPGLSWLKPFIGAVPAATLRWSVVSRLLFGRHVTSASHAVLSRVLAGISPDVLHARLRAALAVDVSREFAPLDVPILYLRATRDRVVPRACAGLIARLNPRARVLDVEGPHFLLQTAPATAAEAVARFMREDAT